jgi:hypothetical protein
MKKRLTIFRVIRGMNKNTRMSSAKRSIEALKWKKRLVRCRCTRRVTVILAIRLSRNSIVRKDLTQTIAEGDQQSPALQKKKRKRKHLQSRRASERTRDRHRMFNSSGYHLVSVPCPLSGEVRIARSLVSVVMIHPLK